MDMSTGTDGVAARMAPHPAIPAAGDFLALHLGGAEYGIAAAHVRELRSWEPPTPVAGTPPCVRGVVNLRGAIVPIVDLRLRLGCVRAVVDACSVVVVLDLRGRIVGAVVDAVSEVVRVGRIRAAAMVPHDGNVDGVGFVDDDDSTGGAGRELLLLDLGELLQAADSDAHGLLAAR